MKFFNGLNPFSKVSGVYEPRNLTKEIKDRLLTDITFEELKEFCTLLSKTNSIESYLMSVFAIWIAIGGRHHEHSNGRASKGLLDILIFPLAARTILNAIDCEYHKRSQEAEDQNLPKPVCTKPQLAALLGFVMPAEFFRFILTAGFTIPLALTVAPVIVVAAKCCVRNTEENVTESPTINYR